MSAFGHARDAQAGACGVADDEDVRQMSLPRFARRDRLRMWPADHAELAARGLIETLGRCRLDHLDAVT